MDETMYTLRGRLDDGISWKQIGYATLELSSAKGDADKFTEHYSCVEAREEGSARVLYRATRPPIGSGSKPRR